MEHFDSLVKEYKMVQMVQNSPLFSETAPKISKWSQVCHWDFTI